MSAVGCGAGGGAPIELMAAVSGFERRLRTRLRRGGWSADRAHSCGEGVAGICGFERMQLYLIIIKGDFYRGKFNNISDFGNCKGYVCDQ